MKKSSFIQLDGQDKHRPIQYLDVKVTMEGKVKSQAVVEELLQGIDISKCMNNHYDSIVFSKLLAILQLCYNIPLQNRQISYYLPQGKVFITCGIYPLGQDIAAELKDLDTNTYLHLKIRNLGLLSINRLMYTQTAVSNVEQDKEDVSDNDESHISRGKKGCRRTKERRIGYIIQKVIQWRKFYSGTNDQARQTQKYSLEEAAKKVGISKKSLDDYLFQIRFGYRYGFNFNEHYNEKVGILRDFVRQQKKVSSKGQNKRKKKVKIQEQQ